MRDSVSVDDRDHLISGEHVLHTSSGQVRHVDAGCDCAPSPDAVLRIDDYREAVPQLQISLTDACNMGCTYCSFRDRVHGDGKPVTMPMPTVRAGIAAHSRHLTDEHAPYTRVDFGLAGETMLVRHLHEQVHSAVADGLAESPVALAWVGPMVTNATLSLAPELADTLGPPQDISVDGPREVHDRVRFYTNDRGGTYDDVRSVLDRVLANHPDMGVSAVLTAYCTDFTMIFRHLYEDIGARNIYMKPVNATHDVDYALNADTLAAFQQGYAELIDHLLSHEPADILDRLLALNAEDFFMRFFYRVKDRGAQVYRCGAGKSGTYLDTNGRLYPCAHFIGKSGWHIGHASTGVDEDKRREYLALTVDSREPCRSCAARYVCGGGCYYQAVLANGDIGRPDEVKCELIRFLTGQAVRLVAMLRQRCPEVLDALPSPFGVAAAESAKPDDPYQPVGRLQPADDDPAIRLGGAGRVRGGLVPASQLSATIERVATELRIGLDLPAQAVAVRVWLQPLGAAFTHRDLAVRKPGDSGWLLRAGEDEASWLDAPRERFQQMPFAPGRWKSIGPEAEVRWEAGQADITVQLSELSALGDSFGLNVFVDFAGGAWTALALHEPFVAVGHGRLVLVGPDAQPLPDVINGRMPDGLVPLGRWPGLQANVC